MDSWTKRVMTLTVTGCAIAGFVLLLVAAIERSSKREEETEAKRRFAMSRCIEFYDKAKCRALWEFGRQDLMILGNDREHRTVMK